MEKQILKKSTELFLQYGFKNVTTEEISTKLGISKKTLYKFFTNKTELIQACIEYSQNEFYSKINEVIQSDKNAVEENFMIHSIYKEMFVTDGLSPMYQLNKYYPSLFEKVQEYQNNTCIAIFTDNVKRGIKQGYYKEDINIEYAVSFYNALILNVKKITALDSNAHKLEEEVLKYHVSSIATEKGLIEFNRCVIKYNV